MNWILIVLGFMLSFCAGYGLCLYHEYEFWNHSRPLGLGANRKEVNPL